VNIKKILAKICEDSDYFGGSSHAAAVMRSKTRIVSIGTNSSKTTPWSKFSDYPYGCAEAFAIGKAANAIGVNALKKCKLVIVRVDKNGNIANSKPCKACQKLIKSVGIKKVEYTK